MMHECFSLPLADDACADIAIDIAIQNSNESISLRQQQQQQKPQQPQQSRIIGIGESTSTSSTASRTRIHRLPLQTKCRDHGIYCDGNCEMSVMELPFPPPSAFATGASASSSTNSSSSSSSSSSLISGTEPFQWYNSLDQRTPLQFLYVTQSLHHPSTHGYTRSESESSQNNAVNNHRGSLATFTPLSFTHLAPASNWGCACPNGACSPHSCSCAQATRNQYSRQSRIQSLAQPQAYCECGQFCSCANATYTDDAEGYAQQNHSGASTCNRPEEADSSNAVASSSQLTAPTVSASNNINSVAVRSTCFNRVVQLNPINPSIRLCVFMTRNKGWGLQTLTMIPRYSYVCEYVGEILHEHVSEIRGTLLAKQNRNNYLFTPSIAAQFSIEGANSRHHHQYQNRNQNQNQNPNDVHIRVSNNPDGYNIDDEPFSIDSSRVGNLARFINHSCEPNLVAVNVYVGHRGDLRAPKVAFFASKKIAAGTELTAHYGDRAAIGQEFICKCDKCQIELIHLQSMKKGKNKKQSRTASESLATEPTQRLSAETLPQSSVAVARSHRSNPHSSDLLQFDPMSPIPLPPTLYLDSTVPSPTNQQLDDPNSIYFHTHTDIANSCASLPWIRYSPAHCTQYISHLRLLVGVNKCIPTQNSCCWFHVHPTRIRMACFSLQQMFPNSSIDFHEQQLEWMRKELAQDEDPNINICHCNEKRTRYENTTSVDASAEVEPSPTSFDCNVCNTAFESRSMLCSHRNCHHSVFICNICGSRSSNALQQSLHQKQMHSLHEQIESAPALETHSQPQLSFNPSAPKHSVDGFTTHESAPESVGFSRTGGFESSSVPVNVSDDEERVSMPVVEEAYHSQLVVDCSASPSSSDDPSESSRSAGSCRSSNGSISPTLHFDRRKYPCQDCDASFVSRFKLSEHRNARHHSRISEHESKTQNVRNVVQCQ